MEYFVEPWVGMDDEHVPELVSSAKPMRSLGLTATQSCRPRHCHRHQDYLVDCSPSGVLHHAQPVMAVGEIAKRCRQISPHSTSIYCPVTSTFQAVLILIQIHQRLRPQVFLPLSSRFLAAGFVPIQALASAYAFSFRSKSYMHEGFSSPTHCS